MKDMASPNGVVNVTKASNQPPDLPSNHSTGPQGQDKHITRSQPSILKYCNT